MMVIFVIIFIWIAKNYRRNQFPREMFLFLLLTHGIVMLKASTRCIGGPQFNSALPVFFITVSMFLDKPANLDSSEISGLIPRGTAKRTRLQHLSLLLCLLLAFEVTGGHYASIKKRLSLMWTPPSALKELDSTFTSRARGTRVPDWQALGLNGVIQFLDENTLNEEKIYTFPSEGQINFLADRQSASRFTVAIYSAVRDEYMQEIVKDLESQKPRFIIYLPHDYELLDVPNEERLKPVWDYIEKNYNLLRECGEFRILARHS
jgi:hypothetical protein